jgi:replicative superfamily II helicase
MGAVELSQRLWSDKILQESVRAITLRSAATDIPALPALSLNLIDADWFHLLRCADVFSQSGDEDFHERALRILHGALRFSAGEAEAALAAAILTKIGSGPAVELAARRRLVPANVLGRLPEALALEVKAHQIAATINIDRPDEFVGNEFQGALWRSLSTNDWVSASAPTSAGKSYLLEKWIERTVADNAQSTIFYLVPTRALISQVDADLRTLLGRRDRDVAISTLPLSFASGARHNVYIYTQERFHLYLLQAESLPAADLIIVDEAQQIGASRRGILLQQVLELASHRYPDAKVLFASPSTKNPESLLAFAPQGKRTASIEGSKPTVNQNLFWVSQVPGKPAEWDVDLLLTGERNPVGRLTLANRPSISQKLPFIAYAVGGTGDGNVIYVNRASDAEKVAEILCQFIDRESDDDELRALSDFCEKAVHRAFTLRRFVKKGVAFHYGNIPQLIRTDVERLFSLGKIRFLVCTSTLVEGVNLSCRNIFMRNPKRGMQDLMTADDFWNLAGRAGRWGKEFQGNVFCVDPLKRNEWLGGSAPTHKQKFTIQIATQRISREFEEFMSYAREEAPSLERSPDRFYEQLLSYLVFRRSTYGDLGLTAFPSYLTTAQRHDLAQVVDDTIGALEVPLTIVHRNPGINPFGMNALLKYFSSKEDDQLENLLPTDPLSDAPVADEESDDTRDAAVDNFIKIFSRITTYLQASRLGKGNSAYGNAILVVNWMRGFPLNRIIEKQMRYWKKRRATKTDQAVIRETLESIETVVRFETPRYLHCYIDILIYHLRERGRIDLVDGIQDFWMFLEFGVAKRTQLSLMGLGLSRSSVISLSDYIKDEALNEDQCLDWLDTNPWHEFGLTGLVVAEIRTILSRHGRMEPPPLPQDGDLSP